MHSRSGGSVTIYRNTKAEVAEDLVAMLQLAQQRREQRERKAQAKVSKARRFNGTSSCLTGKSREH